MKIALIAHDKKKQEIIELAKKYKDVLAKYEASEAKEGFTDLALSPKYLRASQAEREEERKRKEKAI